MPSHYWNPTLFDDINDPDYESPAEVADRYMRESAQADGFRGATVIVRVDDSDWTQELEDILVRTSDQCIDQNDALFCAGTRNGKNWAVIV